MKRATDNFILSFSSLLSFCVCALSSSPSAASAFHLCQCMFLELSFFLFIFTNICIDVFIFLIYVFFPCIGGLEALFHWLTFVAPLLFPYPPPLLLALPCYSSCIIFFVFLTLFSFLHCSVLFHCLRGFLWVFWFASLLLPCPSPLPLPLLALPCHSSSMLPSHKIDGVLNFWIFFNVLAYTSAAIRNNRTYKWYFQVRLYSRTLISSIYKCVLIKCDYTTALINLKYWHSFHLCALVNVSLMWTFGPANLSNEFEY